jgi:hypothetical protein
MANPSLSRSRSRYLPEGDLVGTRCSTPSREARDPDGAEFYPSCAKSSSAIPKRGRSAKPFPSRAHTTTTTREATIQAYTSSELAALSRSAHVEP